MDSREYREVSIPPTEGKEPLPKARILVAEDDEIARSFLTDVLTEAGFDVDVAEDGGEALAVLESKVPDLILSDVIMPGTSGIDLFRKVRENEKLQDVPFIFMTCLEDVDVRVHLEELGPDDYITKPARPRHLLATLRGKLRLQQRRREHAERQKEELRNRIGFTLSHELRTPLTVIQGISELLLNDRAGPSGADSAELLDSLRSQAFHLGGLVENFLLVTRIDSGQEGETAKSDAEECDLGEIIQGTVASWQEKARSLQIAFECEVAERLPSARLCRAHLIEALKQVLDNAFKFADPAAPGVALRAWVEDGRPRISVLNNGRGIPEAQRDKLFTKLTQIDREVHEQQGSGLGLYIARELLELNGATIRVTDGPEGGTLAIIDLSGR